MDKALPASTNDAFCPTLRGAVKSELSPETGAVLEIVIDGLTEADVRNAMRAEGWARLYWMTREDHEQARKLGDQFAQADGFVRYVIKQRQHVG